MGRHVSGKVRVGRVYCVSGAGWGGEMNMVGVIATLVVVAISTQPWQETLDVAAGRKASLENMYSTYVPYASVVNTTGFHTFLEGVADPGANTSSPALLLNAHNAFVLSLLANHACRHDL